LLLEKKEPFVVEDFRGSQVSWPRLKVGSLIPFHCNYLSGKILAGLRSHKHLAHWHFKPLLPPTQSQVTFH
jgi:hypothetical protein